MFLAMRPGESKLKNSARVRILRRFSAANPGRNLLQKKAKETKVLTGKEILLRSLCCLLFASFGSSTLVAVKPLRGIRGQTFRNLGLGWIVFPEADDRPEPTRWGQRVPPYLETRQPVADS